MNDNRIKLTLTEVGRKQISELAKAKSTVSLMIGLGDGSPVASKIRHRSI